MNTFKMLNSAFRGEKALRIESVDGAISVWYYGAEIAVIDKNIVKLYSDGWLDRSTIRHMNKILMVLGTNANIYQKGNDWRIACEDDFQFFDGVEFSF